MGPEFDPPHHGNCKLGGIHSLTLEVGRWRHVYPWYLLASQSGVIIKLQVLKNGSPCLRKQDGSSEDQHLRLTSDLYWNMNTYALTYIHIYTYICEYMYIHVCVCLHRHAHAHIHIYSDT